MPNIRLLSTDFDGTLIGFDSDGRCSPDFAVAISEYHEAGGLWAVNTGRSVEHAVQGLRRFQPPIMPDFLLTCEREVYRRLSDGQWEAHGHWNETCRQRHEELYSLAEELYAVIADRAGKRGGIEMIWEEGRLVGFVTRTEEVMEAFLKEVDLLSADFVDFSYQRNTVYLRFCHRDYHKGSALGELCRLEGLDAGWVLAAGDHYNDIPMLDGRHARHAACPANAIEAVKHRVRLSGGYIAERNYADGVADALAFFERKEAEGFRSTASVGIVM